MSRQKKVRGVVRWSYWMMVEEDVGVGINSLVETKVGLKYEWGTAEWTV